MSQLASVSLASETGSKIDTIFFLGGPGAGKGTQCERLRQMYPQIATPGTGDLLRKFVKNGTPAAKRAAMQMKEGLLVDIDASQDLLLPEFEKYLKNGTKLVIIDGFPRDERILKDWINCEAIQQVANVLFVVEFVCESDELQRRLLSRAAQETNKRSDNNPDAVKNRIKTFNEKTKKVINHYTKLNKYKSINAMLSKDDVFEQLDEIIAPIYDKHYGSPKSPKSPKSPNCINSPQTEDSILSTRSMTQTPSSKSSMLSFSFVWNSLRNLLSDEESGFDQVSGITEMTS